jgi:putative membrane protein
MPVRRQPHEACAVAEPLMQIVRWIVGAALFLALLFLSLQNNQLATLKFYGLWSWEAPLVFIVLIAFAIGVAAGLLAGVWRHTKLKRQIKQLTRADKARVDEAAPLSSGERPRTRD